MNELGVPREQVLHLAAHACDTRAARAAGIAGAYINRHEILYVDCGGRQADLRDPGLVRLADRLAELKDIADHLLLRLLGVCGARRKQCLQGWA